MSPSLVPMITRDPVTGGELIVTRLESPQTGMVIEGRFSLGWIGRLTPEQLDFVGLLLRSRNNLQKVANDLGVAYNTARSRLDDVVEALGGTPGEEAAQREAERRARRETLDRLAAGDIDVEQALAALRTPKEGDR